MACWPRSWDFFLLDRRSKEVLPTKSRSCTFAAANSVSDHTSIRMITDLPVKEWKWFAPFRPVFFHHHLSHPQHQLHSSPPHPQQNRRQQLQTLTLTGRRWCASQLLLVYAALPSCFQNNVSHSCVLLPKLTCHCSSKHRIATKGDSGSQWTCQLPSLKDQLPVSPHAIDTHPPSSTNKSKQLCSQASPRFILACTSVQNWWHEPLILRCWKFLVIWTTKNTDHWIQDN